MDITKHLTNIDIPANDENQIEKFIALKGSELNNSILKLWDEFLLSEKNGNFESQIITNQVTDQTDSQDETLLPNNQSESVENKINPDEDLNITPDEPKPVICEEPQCSIPITTPQQLKDEIKEKAQNEALAAQIKSKFITLPNGKVGQPYNFVFSVDKIGIADIEDFWFEGLKPLGLLFDPETDAITGTPIIAGEQSIKLLLKLKGWIEGKPVFDRKLTLTVNPDPRSLWKNIPSKPTEPYWKPDSAFQFLKVESTSHSTKAERKDVVAASQRGRSHAHEGIFRDDDFGIDFDKSTNWYIITVADGAGSAKASRKGSQIACQTVVNVCKTQLESRHKDFELLLKDFSKDKSDENRKKVGDAIYGILGTAVFKACKNIEQEALNSGRALKDFSTTLIVSICKKFRYGWFVGAFWVGDGGIGIYNKDKRFLKVLGESDGGEFAGQTRFLTMPEITQPAELYRRLRFDIVDEFTALILMSDGITDPKFETDANLLKIEKWDELWVDLSKEVEFKDNNEQSAEQLLKWLDFWSPGNHDDRTIAILF